MAQVDLRSVTKKFGQVVAVDSLDLSIRSGECFSMLGPSGCGKTTTLRMVAGFEDLDGGEIEVAGKLVSSPAKNFYLPPEKRGFGMVFQAFAVWPHLTVYENVAFPLRLRKMAPAEIDSRAREALRHTNLLDSAKASPMDLSGGGKQRVALARALAMNPGVMLLDEPLSSLDPHLREEMRFEIKDLQRHYGFTILYVTHDQAEAMALSDRIMIMRQGVVQQVGTPLEVYERPANRFVFSFIGLSNFLKVDLSEGSVRLEGAGEPMALTERPEPALAASGQALLASRPYEIDFLDQGGLGGVVKRRTFLGEITDYSVDLGGQELRVQKPRHAPGPGEGEACRLGFARPTWYPVEDV